MLVDAVKALKRTLPAGHPRIATMSGNLEQVRAALVLNADAASEGAPSGAADKAVVTIVGLVDFPELNDRVADVQSWSAEQGRYKCRICADEATGSTKLIAIKPANVLLAQGSQVIVTGVKGEPAMNGRIGVVRAFVSNSGRYRVEVSGRDRPANLKPENLRIRSTVTQ